VAQYGLRIRNERGDTLIEFCSRNKFIVTNTYFNHHRRRRYIWKVPGDIRRMQLDYILVKVKLKNQIKNCRSFLGADIGSDHNTVIMTCELKFKKLPKRKSRCIEP
jgi:hypothetical protein